MPRFYLHVRQGEKFIRDPEGVVFHDPDSARQAAVRAARELAADCVKFDRPVEGQVEVDDEQGQNLLVIPLKDTVTIKA